jgi:predicted nucleotidyltransferase
METTKNKLTDYEVHFFKSLSEYLGTKFLFFGSVQREDYFPGKSDIDVDIFTENERSTLIKMQHFLKVPKEEFKKIYWKLNSTGELVKGKKLMYKNPAKNLCIEFSIYNEKYKEGVLKEHLRKTILPFYATWMLTFIKLLYYHLEILSNSWYKYMKKKILSLGIGLPEDAFIILDEDPDSKYNSYLVE